jgi:hypothetical protein
MCIDEQHVEIGCEICKTTNNTIRWFTCEACSSGKGKEKNKSYKLKTIFS